MPKYTGWTPTVIVMDDPELPEDWTCHECKMLLPSHRWEVPGMETCMCGSVCKACGEVEMKCVCKDGFHE